MKCSPARLRGCLLRPATATRQSPPAPSPPPPQGGSGLLFSRTPLDREMPRFGKPPPTQQLPADSYIRRTGAKLQDNSPARAITPGPAEMPTLGAAAYRTAAQIDALLRRIYIPVAYRKVGRQAETDAEQTPSGQGVSTSGRVRDRRASWLGRSSPAPRFRAAQFRHHHGIGVHRRRRRPGA